MIFISEIQVTRGVWSDRKRQFFPDRTSSSKHYLYYWKCTM